FADHPQLDDVAHRRGGAVGVDVGDGRAHGGQGGLHAAHGAFAAGGDHVGAIRGGAVAGDLGVDLRAARPGVLELLEHHHAAAAGDDEAVAVGVVRSRGGGRAVVVLGG